MLVPLLSGSGLRIKIIEGMAYGKAIISTSIGAEGIPIKDGIDLVLADSKEEFTKAVLELLNDSSRLNSLQINSRKFAEENFDNKTITSELVDFYTELKLC
jgi:glycosyltransferase involved in cell wall biosynthesis